MEKGFSLERYSPTLEQRLEEIQSRAIPADEAKRLQEQIAVLVFEHGGSTAESDRLQAQLDASTLTVQTLGEFTTLLEKVAFSPEHIAAVLENRKDIPPQAEQAGIHNEGYSLLVMKEGNEFRYVASQNISRLEIRQPQEALHEAIPQLPDTRSAEDEAKIQRLREEAEESYRDAA